MEYSELYPTNFINYHDYIPRSLKQKFSWPFLLPNHQCQGTECWST